MPSKGEPSVWSLQAVGRSGNVVGLVGEPGNDRLRTRVALYCRSTRQGGQGTVEVLEPSQVRCRLVGFGRVASKVTRLPVKPDRVRKYLSGIHYQYTPLYPVSVSGPGGSTTPCQATYAPPNGSLLSLVSMKLAS